MCDIPKWKVFDAVSTPIWKLLHADLQPDCHFEKMDEIATNYWAGVGLKDITPMVNQATNTFEPVTTIELLVQSDIQIVECLNYI